MANLLGTQRNLSNAIFHEERVRMHTVVNLRGTTSNAMEAFLTRVRKILVPDKAAVFESLINYPLVTNEICKTIFQEYPRVLSAANRYVKVSFNSPEVEQRFAEFLAESGFEDFWNGEAMKALYSSHNMFLACDKDEEGKPYFYSVPVRSVRDVVMSSETTVESIKFTQDSIDTETYVEKFAEFDKETIKITATTKDGETVILKEFRHGLGFCPACKFLPKALDKDFADSENPITACLNELDDYLFWHTCGEHYKLYGAFPIYWAYRERCNYVDEQLGVQCDGGKLVYVNEANETKIKPCPKCSTKPFIGAGTLIQIEPPATREDATIGVPVGKVDVDVDALNFLQEEQEMRKKRIEFDAAGRVFEANKEAINELQVQANYETRKIVLENLSKTLSKSMWFVLDTLAKLAYPQYHVSTACSLGNQFFLKTVAELNAEYKDLKQTGRPMFELRAKRDEISQTQYQNNPEALNRMAILRQLEPYGDLSISELVTTGLRESDPDNFFLKLMFGDLVSEFERRFAPVEVYGSELPMNWRVKSIKNELIKIKNEQRIIIGNPDEV